MTERPIDRQDLLSQRSRLFAPGERLGWIFRDRWQFMYPLPEPAPVPQQVSPHLVHQAQTARQVHSRRLSVWLAISVGLFMLFFLLGACAQAVTGSGFAGGLIIGLIAATPGAVIITLSALSRSSAERKVRDTDQALRQQYEQQMQQWQARKTVHEQAERARVDTLDEWGAARTPPGTRRVDIFGGNLWSWEAFLTVYGTSKLVDHPLMVIDLSREVVCRELAVTARAAGAPVDAQLLPDQLSETTLLADLSPRQLVDALIESMYGDDPNAARAQRSMDDRILTRLCEALGDDLSMGRVAAGLRALMDEPDDAGYLTGKERNYIADELFSAEYRGHAREALHRLESYIQPLETLGTQSEERDPAYLTCIALNRHGRNVRSELLTDLMVQWLTNRITTVYARPPAVIIAQADELARRHLERLSDVCERHHVHLTLLFRHLRETAQDLLGGGAVGFMQLGNHHEAREAADFIGREHKFVLTQLTKTLGGNETHTTTETEAESETEGITLSTAVGWATNWSKTAATAARAGRSTFGSLFDEDRTRTTGQTTGRSRSVTETRARSWSTTRNWSTAYAYAEGTNWSNAASTQRVYEYTVEPRVLQTLPDYAMLLLESRPGGGMRMHPVEVDPAIITLPRVSTDPLPDLPRPPQLPTTSPAAPAANYPHQMPHQQPGMPPPQPWPPRRHPGPPPPAMT